jgi:hypothetical protein
LILNEIPHSFSGPKWSDHERNGYTASFLDCQRLDSVPRPLFEERQKIQSQTASGTMLKAKQSCGQWPVRAGDLHIVPKMLAKKMAPLGVEVKLSSSPNFPPPACEHVNLIPEIAVRDGSRAKNIDWKKLPGSDQKTSKIETMIKTRSL